MIAASAAGALVVGVVAVALVIGGGDGGSDDQGDVAVVATSQPPATDASATEAPDTDAPATDAPATAPVATDAADPLETAPVVVGGEPLPTPDSTDPGLGMSAPALRGFSFDGSPVEIRPGDGTPTMLVFVAHWCPFCQDEVPRLVDWYESGDVPAGLRVVGVSTAVVPSRPNYPPSAWLAREGWPWEVLVDSEFSAAARAYGLDGLPSVLVIDGQGDVVARHTGLLDADGLQQLAAAAMPS